MPAVYWLLSWSCASHAPFITPLPVCLVSVAHRLFVHYSWSAFEMLARDQIAMQQQMKGIR